MPVLIFLGLYWSFEHFIKNFDNSILKSIMKNQVSSLAKKGVIDSSFIGLDSTPVFANTSQNNPKSFSKNKFSKSNQPISDKDCRLGVHSASNQFNEKNFDFYWGYKNHTLVDLISGLPIYEMTTTANIADSSVALDVLSDTHLFLSLDDCTFIADKGYDVKYIYNKVHELYNGECIIPLNKRNSKNHTLSNGCLICDAGLKMKNAGTFSDSGRTRRKFICPLRYSKSDVCPCDHKNFFNGKKNRGCNRYITVPDDLRLGIDRNSKLFKTTYSLRSECERNNSRFKKTGQERVFVRNISSVTNINTIAHISLLAVAVSAIICKSTPLFAMQIIRRLGCFHDFFVLKNLILFVIFIFLCVSFVIYVWGCVFFVSFCTSLNKFFNQKRLRTFSEKLNFSQFITF